jgi:hypothetical protein
VSARSIIVLFALGAVLVALGTTVVALAVGVGSGAGVVEVAAVQETPDVAALPDWVTTDFTTGEGNVHAVLFGTADHAVGKNRVSFAVVRRDDQSLVQAPKAFVSYGLGTWSKALETQAALQPIGPHTHAGRTTEPHDHPGATDVYVTTLRFPEAGRYWFVVQSEGREPPGVGVVDVGKRQATPAVGSHAIPSDNPTLADAPAKKITTARPPDIELLRHSVADSLRANAPFVVAFATPAHCQSRVCGPTVEVVDKVRMRLGKRNVRFIHIEIYSNNRPENGFNRWVREWRLPTEPWVFLVDRRGVIREKFEGALSVEELEAAVRRHLL